MTRCGNPGSFLSDGHGADRRRAVPISQRWRARSDMSLLLCVAHLGEVRSWFSLLWTELRFSVSMNVIFVQRQGGSRGSGSILIIGIRGLVSNRSKGDDARISVNIVQCNVPISMQTRRVPCVGICMQSGVRVCTHIWAGPRGLPE